MFGAGDGAAALLAALRAGPPPPVRRWGRLFAHPFVHTQEVRECGVGARVNYKPQHSCVVGVAGRFAVDVVLERGGVFLREG